MTLLTGLIGISMLLAFLTLLTWWIKEVPFTIIVVVVVAMLVYDFAQTLRNEDGHRGR